MATVASLQQQQQGGRGAVLLGQGKQAHHHTYSGNTSTVRSMSSVSTVSVETTSGADSWVRSKKRDWDNAFLTKYQDLETTLHENDKWLAIYWQSIASMKDTKKHNMAITEALKTSSSSKRRARSRMDVRDVFFAGSISSATSSDGTLRMSPLQQGLQFGTATMHRRGKQRRSSSHYGSMQSNTLNMTLAEMAMIPPKSPYLTNVVVSPPSAATTLANSAGSAPETAVGGTMVRKKEISSVPSLRTQRSQDSAVAHKVVEMRRQPSGPLVRSNSTAAQTVAAVKLLQNTASPTGASGSGESPEEEDVRPATPEPPKQPQQQQQRFTPRTTVPTLRDMILYRQSPSKPTQQQQQQAPKQRTPPLTNIDMALGSLSLDAAGRKQKAAQDNDNTIENSTPSRAPAVLQHPRTVSNASSQGSAMTSRSEEDVRERLQRIRIALGRSSTAAMQAVDEQLDGNEAELGSARERIDRIEAALSPQTTQEDITALCQDIDEVENMLPPSASATPTRSDGQQRSGMYVDVDIDVDPIRMDDLGDSDSVQMDDDAHHTSPSKRKHSDDEKPGADVPNPPVGSRLLAPTASTLAKGRGKARGGGPQPNAVSSGIPRRPAGAVPRALAVPPRTDSRVAHAAGGRVAEARRKFDAPASFVTPVAAMRPGASSNMASAGPVRRPPGTSTKPHAKPALKSSTAAMREAARKAEAIRAHAAAASASARRPVGARPKPQQQQQQQPSGSGSAAKASQRPAPLATDSSDGSGSDDGPRRGIPIPKRNGTAASTGSSSAAESADSSSSRWGGVTSMLAMLSPSSWKTQTEADAAHQTPTGAPARKTSTSPYDVASPQTPYQPRPEHSGSQSHLVMPTYKDMSVPLRRSGSRPSSSSEASAGAPRRTSRVSGVSSLFTDDSVSVAPLARAKSTPDLAADDPALVTPAQNGRRLTQRVSSARSDDYTSIIPAGSDSPPDVESDYSDEYLDDEFSPAPRPKKNNYRIPKWATTPELAKGLQRQELVNPDRIFGRFKPLRINDVFNRTETVEQRRKPRNSSMIWSAPDDLTADEELAYIRRMGFE